MRFLSCTTSIATAFRIIRPAMTKRQRSDTASRPVKRIRTTSAAQTSPSTFNPIKIATAEAGEAANENPPLPVLLKSVEDGVREPVKGECVVYWMRMADLRGTHLSFHSAFVEPLCLYMYQSPTTELFLSHPPKRLKTVFLSSSFSSSVPKIMLPTIDLRAASILRCVILECYM